MKAYDEIMVTPAPIFLLGHGDKVKWRLNDSYCEDPRCNCGRCEFSLVAEHGGHRVPFRTEMNAAGTKANWATNLSEADQALVQEFTHAQENLRFLDRRRQIVRAWALSKTAGPKIRREAGLLGLSDFALDGSSFAIPFAWRGQQWAAIDVHCKACPCDKAVLVFHEADRHERALVPRYAVSVELTSGRVRDADTEGPPSPEAERAMSAFEDELGTWESYLHTRGVFVRELARLRLHGAVLVGAAVGRNDPCPCGSGSKFKKCCG